MQFRLSIPFFPEVAIGEFTAVQSSEGAYF
jgi:hypothetical protein